MKDQLQFLTAAADGNDFKINIRKIVELYWCFGLDVSAEHLKKDQINVRQYIAICDAFTTLKDELLSAPVATTTDRLVVLHEVERYIESARALTPFPEVSIVA